MTKTLVTVAAGAALIAAAHGTTAAAGDYNGNFMVRAGLTVVHPDTSADVFNLGAIIPGADADVSTEVIPSLTLTYFFNKNLAAELFCCFAKHQADGEGAIAGVDLGDFWIFPPALTLQYHFDPVAGFKPYVGAGVQYINFFGEGDSNLAPNSQIKLDDAFGFTLQAGVDIELGRGWYANLDVKKTWLETDARWTNTDITADIDVDPWLFTAGIGYRFNLADVFGRRHAVEPLK